MSKLDKIKSTHRSGLLKVEILVEGEWVSMALASKQSIIKVADLLDQLSDEDCEREPGSVTPDIIYTSDQSSGIHNMRHYGN